RADPRGQAGHAAGCRSWLRHGQHGRGQPGGARFPRGGRLGAGVKNLQLDDLPVVGALDRDRTASRVVFRRLPGWTRPQIVDPALALLVTMPAGVRLEFNTDAREPELDVLL